MIACLIVVGALLAGQIGAGADQYQGSRIAGQGGAGNNGGAGGANITPLGNPASTSPSDGAGRGAAPPPGNSNSFNASPPPGYSTQPLGGGQKDVSPGAYQVPANSPAGTAPTGPPAADSQPTAMMKAMLSAPRDSQLRGDSVSLVQVVSGAPTRSEQTRRVEAYWDLCASVADYYLGLREQDELRQLGASLSRPGTTMTDAEKALSARVGASLRAARASQLRLASYIGRGSNNLPLPSDAPHCGSFTTNYEQIFARRSSPEAQELAALLPQRFAELKDLAADVSVDQEWFNGIAANRSDASDGNLKALKLLALGRRAFVQIVRDYNRRIARYSELAMPSPISAEKLTGVLIKRPASATATRSGSPAPPPTRTSSGVDSGPPPTFAKTGATGADPGSNAAVKRDESVRPASASDSKRDEHSLLVPLH